MDFARNITAIIASTATLAQLKPACVRVHQHASAMEAPVRVSDQFPVSRSTNGRER